MTRFSVRIRSIIRRVCPPFVKRHVGDLREWWKYRRSLESKLGNDAYDDMCRLTQAGERPVVFDVGANIGQTIIQMHRRFRSPIIHSFEPDPCTFRQLQRRTAKLQNVTACNAGLGSSVTTLDFFRNDHSDMSSFLPLGDIGWGAVRETISVPVTTVDAYSAERGIDRIDILKSDTQGFDFEVLRGAERMMREGRVHLVYLEINFAELYKGAGTLDAIYKHLTDRDYRLVSFYRCFYREGKAAWSDALFVLPRFGHDRAPRDVRCTGTAC
jgi:FkbM family methyltransferase